MDGPASIVYCCAKVDAMDDAHVGICNLADEYDVDAIFESRLGIVRWSMVDR